jgi:CRISPR-associated exonuclease Cas4
MDRASIPLSLLNDYLFCKRRAGLKLIENERGSNVHTAEGDIVHDRVDTPGYHVLRGVTVLRALPVWSDTLGLSGICDVVERHPDGSLVPVEFKKSHRKEFINDDVQVCAQGMCIEECMGVSVPRGAIFYSASKLRRDVTLDESLRALTLRTIEALRQFRDGDAPLPPAEPKRACAGCSLVELCMPSANRLRQGASAWFERHVSDMINRTSSDESSP